MATYHLNIESNNIESNNIESNVLKVRFEKPANGNQVIKDAVVGLEKMVRLGGLSGEKLLKIDGPASVAVTYLIAHQISQFYGALAIFDAKIDRPGYKTFIIAVFQTPAYKTGELIETDEAHKNKLIIKVLLCSHPQSGKLCLRAGLKQAIFSIEGAPYLDMITACPDGENVWFSDSARRDSNLARLLKDEYKAKFTAKFAQTAASWVWCASTLLNIIDISRKITEKNRVIVREATHAVILAGDRGKDEVGLWEDFSRDWNLPIIANLDSDYHGKDNKIVTKSPFFTGTVNYLALSEDLSCRPMVQALAQVFVGLV
jgi:CRISPR-associated protein Csx3